MGDVMKTLLLDVDDVLTSGNFKRVMEDYLGRKIDESEIKGYFIQEALGDKRDDFFDNYFFQHDVYKDAVLEDGAYDTVKKLCTKYDVYICSDYLVYDRPKRSGEFLNFKYEFLIKALDFFPMDHFIFSSKKSLVHTDIKIDDKITHLENGNMKLLFTAYHNVNISDEELKNKNIIRVNSWKDIEDILLK
jgi:5'(3')-deoxyribonucleotidase